MSRMLLALPLLLVACNTTEPAPSSSAPETKKVSLNLKETCDKGLYYKPEWTPTTWEAYVSWTGQEGYQSTPLDLTYTDKGFVMPCGLANDTTKANPTLSLSYGR